MQVELYRGVRDVLLNETFLRDGGTELAPMSTTADLRTAIQYAKSSSSVLLRLRTRNFMVRGPDVSWCSCFPREREFLYPPLTYIQPVLNAEGAPVIEELPVDDAVFHVVDVEPIFS